MPRGGAVTQLPNGRRELVELVYWDGFSTSDAAQMTGISASTVRSRYAAAKARFRTVLVYSSKIHPSITTQAGHGGSNAKWRTNPSGA